MTNVLALLYAFTYTVTILLTCYGFGLVHDAFSAAIATLVGIQGGMWWVMWRAGDVNPITTLVLGSVVGSGILALALHGGHLFRAIAAANVIGGVPVVTDLLYWRAVRREIAERCFAEEEASLARRLHEETP